jgi:hypothetical protein
MQKIKAEYISALIFCAFRRPPDDGESPAYKILKVYYFRRYGYRGYSSSHLTIGDSNEQTGRDSSRLAKTESRNRDRGALHGISVL